MTGRYTSKLGKILFYCRYVTPQHQRCRKKALAVCDTDWINNISVNRVYTTRLLAITAKRVGRLIRVFPLTHTLPRTSNEEKPEPID